MMPDLQLYYRTGETNSMGLSINTDMPTKRTKASETNQAAAASAKVSEHSLGKPLPQTGHPRAEERS